MSFTTTEDGQSTVEVHVLQVKESWPSTTNRWPKFFLEGITRSPKGVPKIDVTFDIDADGIVHVHAKDAGSGIKQSVSIKRTSA